MSTAIGPDVTVEERIAPVAAIKPEMASLNTNSMNAALANWKTGENDINDRLYALFSILDI